MWKILRGGLAGALATGVMTLVILLGKATGLLQTPPPKQITARTAEKSGADPHAVPEPAFQAGWMAAHFGFGIGCGVLYALIRPILPERRGLTGLLYGGAIYAVSYLGLLPALGLYPWPDEDSSSRTAVMIAAHAVYGVALAETAG